MEVYLDNHSGTKTDPRVIEEMMPYLKEIYGNPQNDHYQSLKSKEALEKARERVAYLINAKSSEIFFTSCGSESNNLAIKGAIMAYRTKGNHVIVSSIEHFSVLYAVKRLEQILGLEVTYIDVDNYGVVNVEQLKNSLREETILVSIQHANPEIGTIQPIEEISSIIREFNKNKKGDFKTIFHTDAVASCGIIEVDVEKLGVDLLSLSGSQFYGPRGAASLYIRKGIRITPQIDGGIQEGGIRAGTENVPAIVGLGKAAEIAKEEMKENYERIRNLRDRLFKGIKNNVDYVYLNGHPEKRLPSNLSLSFEFVEGESITLLLNERGIYVSSGSACASKALKMSHVLKSINVDPAIGQGTITFTLSKYNTEEEIDYVIGVLPPIIKKLRELSPLYSHFIKTGERMPAGPGTDYEEHFKEEDTYEY